MCVGAHVDMYVYIIDCVIRLSLVDFTSTGEVVHNLSWSEIGVWWGGGTVVGVFAADSSCSHMV